MNMIKRLVFVLVFIITTPLVVISLMFGLIIMAPILLIGWVFTGSYNIEKYGMGIAQIFIDLPYRVSGIEEL